MKRRGRRNEMQENIGKEDRRKRKEQKNSYNRNDGFEVEGKRKLRE